MFPKIMSAIFLFWIHFITNAQVDSSKIFSGMLTGGNSKSWYTRPGIIDNLKQTHYSTLTFKLKTKTGSLNKSGAGRDMASSFRNFNNWRIEKQNEKYVLIISSKEKYSITFISLNENILILKSLEDNGNHKINISGKFYETPIKLE